MQPIEGALTRVMKRGTVDIISIKEAGSLPGLFRERVNRTPNDIAFRYYDETRVRWDSYSWRESAHQIQSIQAALAKEEDLEPGDRVGIMMRNCPNWVFFEQAALGLGLVVVPLYINDRPENIAYVLQNALVKVLFLENASTLKSLKPIASQLQGLIKLISVESCSVPNLYTKLVTLDEWRQPETDNPELPDINIDDMATLVYTSGTTGSPKGVMLSHRNILFNARAALELIQIYREDLFLSFLPLSHMLERTVGYYIPVMTGSTVAFARSIQTLPLDLLTQKPTILISVPRIYDKVYNKILLQLEKKSSFAQKLFHSTVELGWLRFKQGLGGGLKWPILKILVANKILAKLGGRLRLAICGGAPISPEVAKTFIGLGLNLIPGYGLTETSPIITGNTINNNYPDSVGIPLPGIEVKLGDNDELLVRSPSNMMGYWDNIEATQEVIDNDGWLHTGDIVKIENDHIFITGRLKDILVLSNGEKVPPADMELAITLNPLFEQVLIIGEGKPFLSALIVLNPEIWQTIANKNEFDVIDKQLLDSKKVKRLILNLITDQLKGFPGYARVKAIKVMEKPWTVEDGTMTPTMKLKRPVITERNQYYIRKMYEGH